jgi:hypothetical protein
MRTARSSRGDVGTGVCGVGVGVGEATTGRTFDCFLDRSDNDNDDDDDNDDGGTMGEDGYDAPHPTRIDVGKEAFLLSTAGIGVGNDDHNR